MSKYKLINTNTKKEHLCDKITIDGFDYYVSEEQIKIGDKGWLYEDGHVKSLYEFDCTEGLNGITISDRKIIATTNPNIDVPKVVDEIEELANQKALPHLRAVFIEGYNKSQETHSNTDEDMIGFLTFVENNYYYNSGCWINGETDDVIHRNELLQLWKEQQPKIVYYA